MDAFDLDETVIGHYKAFARSFTNIRSPELNAKVDDCTRPGASGPNR